MHGHKSKPSRVGIVIASLGLVGVFASGCAGDPCQEAVAHAERCLGGEQAYYDAERALASCDPGQAAELLGQSCETLAQRSASAGKADGCVWWMPWTCWTSGGGGSSSSGKLGVTLNACGDYFGITDCNTIYGGLTCVRVTVEDEAGQQVASGYTGQHSSVAFDDLAAGSYTVKVWRRGHAALATMVDAGIVETRELPAELEVQVSGSGDTQARLYFAPDEGPRLTRCSKIKGELIGRCGGAVLDPEETEWRWLVELEPLDGQSDERQLLRPLKMWQEATQSATNRFWFSRLMPGRYRLVVHEMAIPSYRRRNNPDYESLKRWYTAHAGVAEQTITVPEVPSDELEVPAFSVSCQ